MTPPTPDAPGFAEGTAQGGTAFAVMHIATLIMSFFIAKTIHKFGDNKVYAFCLAVGGLGFLSMQLTTDLYTTLACMALVGVGWAGVITVPFHYLCKCRSCHAYRSLYGTLKCHDLFTSNYGNAEYWSNFRFCP